MRTPTPTGDPLFDEFWAAYPKKVAKPKAIRAFARLHMTRELLDIILADIRCKQRTERWKKQDGLYIPYPASYLNDRRWEDEVTLPQQPEGSHSYNLDDYKSLMNRF